MLVNGLNCKICGGEVAPDEAGVTCECRGCGAEGMFPKSDVKKLNRATYLRDRYEFDRARAILDELIAENPEDGEAYWNRLLATYGIRYARSGKRLPTCRVDVSALPAPTEAEDYKKTLYYATEEAQAQYTAMGERLAECVDASRRVFAEPQEYDLFILTDEKKNADDDLDGEKLYLRFTENLGFRVFYAPETLKETDDGEKPARIAAAIANSRLMLAVFKAIPDTVSGYMNYATRLFLQGAERDEGKILLPIFNSKSVAYQELPEALVWGDEAFDLSDPEFMREISDAVEKILKPEDAAVVPDSIVTATAANKENLIKRAYMFLEDGEFETADTYFDKILDIDIEDSRAYIGKLLAEYKLTSDDQIPGIPMPVTDNKNFIKALRFATPEQKARYEALNGAIVENIENEKKRISEERQRLNAEREEKEAIERQRRERQMKEERKLQFQRRRDPLRKTLAEVRAELNKTMILPARRKELKEQEETLVKNIKELEAQFPDIWD
ncbi:MAG: hypothetical protein NC084_03200 [Bacteroides sp.]|nr:hypothetical protein [Eubacterium sp.]MCM1417586.1 hypothetical protein [Roseburia sp.]MCM1461703.1 hypothetical protein [Bacteroides sp.]